MNATWKALGPILRPSWGPRRGPNSAKNGPQEALNFSLIFLGLLKNFFPTKNLNFNYDIEQSIIGGVVGYLTIWIIIFLYKKLKNLDAMGFGDAKLMAAIGTFFGLKSSVLLIERKHLLNHHLLL